MAIRNAEEENNNTTGTGTPGQATGQAPGQTRTGPLALNFGSGNTGLINPNNIDSKIAKLAVDLKTIFVEANAKAEINVFSNILTISILRNAKVFYYIMVPGSISTELTVSQFMETVSNNMDPKLTVDNVTPQMHKYIVNELKKVYSSTTVSGVTSLDGIVIPYGIDTADENLVKALAGTSYNTCSLEASITSGEARDVNIRESITRTKGVSRLKQYSLTQETNDYFSRPTRTSFGVELTAPQTQGFLSSLTNEEIVCATKGYINILPKNYRQAYPGMVPIDRVGFMGNIVINMIDQPIPTLGYAFIGMASTAVMAKDYNWVKPIMANLDNIGHLNKIVNINSDKQGGKVIDLVKLKMTPDEKAGLIIKLIDQGITLSVDVPMLDNKITTLTPIAAAATSHDPAVVKAAEQDIINTMNIVTDGEFSKFFKGQIFDGRGVILPQGEFATDKGQMSIDHVDAPYIMKNYANNYNELISNLMFSELAYSGDPFLERVRFLQKIGIDAKLTGKKIRVTFSTVFVEAMLNSFMSCGLDPQFDNTSVINRQTGLDFTSNYFNHANLQNVPQFGHSSQGNQNGFGYKAGFATSYYQ